MHPADSALGIFRSPDPDLCVPGTGFCVPKNPDHSIYICSVLFIIHVPVLVLYK